MMPRGRLNRKRQFNTKFKLPAGFLTLLFIYFVLALSVLLVFWQVRDFEFVNYDDHVYVFENQQVLNGLTGDGVIWAFTTGHVSNWHPVTWLSLMLDCQFFGPDPGRLHLVNVLLHLANTLLLFAVLKKMTCSLWPSAFVAAAFAIHPMHVESVAWIAERKDVLSTLFLLLTLAAYVGYVRRPSIFRYISALVLFALGLMAKPMLVTLPFILLLLDYWPLNRFETIQSAKTSGGKPTSVPDRGATVYRIIIEKIPFFILTVASSVITFIVQQRGGAIKDIDIFSLESRFANALLSYVSYIGKMFWPQNLAVLYPFDATSEIPLRQLVLYALLLAGVTLLVLYLGRRRKYLPVGWFWFVGTLIPVIGLVQVGFQAYADRYTYIPYIGLFIMMAWGAGELFSKWPYRKVILGTSMVTVLIAVGFCTHRQVSFWKDSITLFSHAVAVTQNNHIMYNSLGVAYGKQSHYPKAIEACEKAIRIKPDYAKAYNSLGAAYIGLNRYPEAIEACEQAIRFKSDYLGAYYNLGVSCYNSGRYEKAIEAYKQMIRIKPDNAKAHFFLGFAYVKVSDNTSALQEYKILKTLDTKMAKKLFDMIEK